MPSPKSLPTPQCGIGHTSYFTKGHQRVAVLLSCNPWGRICLPEHHCWALDLLGWPSLCCCSSGRTSATCPAEAVQTSSLLFWAVMLPALLAGPYPCGTYSSELRIVLSADNKRHPMAKHWLRYLLGRTELWDLNGWGNHRKIPFWQ